MSDLYALYRLHKIDSALYGLKKEAEALDLGAAEKAEAQLVGKQLEQIGAQAKSLTAEIKLKEFEQKGIVEKIASITKKIFDGSIVSPREIENLQKEIEMLKALSEKNDERLLELYETAPPVISESEFIRNRVESMRKDIETKTAAAIARHNEIKREFDSQKRDRKTIAAEVDSALLAQYESVRKHTGSTGVASVSEQNACEQCGMAVPIKQRQMLKDDRVTLCEGCHRILFMAVFAD